MSDHLAAIRALHAPRDVRPPYSDNHKVPGRLECRHCHRPYPCRTIELLDTIPAPTEPAGEREALAEKFDLLAASAAGIENEYSRGLNAAYRAAAMWARGGPGNALAAPHENGSET